MIVFQCKTCRQEVIEGDDAFERLLGPKRVTLHEFASVFTCKSCTRKAQAKADWVAVARTDYKGWLGAFGRWYCGVNAAVMFEQAWTKDWKNTRDEKTVATAIGDFLCSFGDDGVKVLSGPTPMPNCKPLRPDAPPPAPPSATQNPPTSYRGSLHGKPNQK
jgi:hypothetical protein